MEKLNTSEEELLKASQEEQIKKEAFAEQYDDLFRKGLKCHWCNTELVNDSFWYKCAFHNNSFCEKCVFNKEPNYAQATRCKDNPLFGPNHIDCIWNKYENPIMIH